MDDSINMNHLNTLQDLVPKWMIQKQSTRDISAFFFNLFFFKHHCFATFGGNTSEHMDHSEG